MAWTADLSNDPDNGYALIIDVWEGEEHRGRIERDAGGEIVLRVHADAVIPAAWLAKLLTQAEEDLKDSAEKAPDP